MLRGAAMRMSLRSEVLEETLKYWPLKATRQTRLFERRQNGQVLASKEFGLAGFHQALEKVLRPTASVISTLTQLKHPLSQMLWNVAVTVQSNILIEVMDVKDDAVARHYAGNPKHSTALHSWKGRSWVSHLATFVRSRKRRSPSIIRLCW